MSRRTRPVSAACGLATALMLLAGCGGEALQVTPAPAAPQATAATAEIRLPMLTGTPPTIPAGATLASGATRTSIVLVNTPAVAAPSPPAGTPMVVDNTGIAATATGFAAAFRTAQALTPTPTTAPTMAAQATARPTTAPSASMMAAQPTARPTDGPTTAPAANLAPEIAIPEPGRWFNSAPLTLGGLRGKPVLLVFWSDI